MILRVASLVFCAWSGASVASDLGGITAPLVHAPTNPLVKTFQAPPASVAPAVVTSQGESAIAAPAVLAALQNELTARYGLEGDLKLTFSKEWKPITVPAGRDWKLIVDQAPAGGLGPRPVVSFRIESHGKSLGNWQEPLRASLFQPVWVATRRLDRGEVPDSSSCSLKTVDTLADNLSYLPADTDLSVHEMSQTVAQDRPLTSRDLALRPLVRKNQLVDVMVSEGSLNISMKGLALGTGGAGQMIPVRNLDSRKDFQAQVVGVNTVQVRF